MEEFGDSAAFCSDLGKSYLHIYVEMVFCLNK